jgi:hypothetical protein
MATRNIRNLFRKTKEQSTFTESEAQYAAAAQQELADATAALFAVIQRGLCNAELQKQIVKTSEMIQAEALVNHNVIENFLIQIEQK